MRIISNTPKLRSVGPAQKSQAATSGFLEKTKTESKTPARPLDALIPRQELVSIAADYKSGAINRDEAGARFVDAVIKNSLNDQLSEHDRAKMVDKITQFCKEDEDFMKQLGINFTDLV